jgi:TolB protein
VAPRNPGAEAPAVSPDGDVIAFSGSDDRIWLVGVDGTGERPITPSGVGGYEPVWSPDGTQILFDGAFAGPGELMIVEADASSVRVLVKSSADECCYAWSEDGKQVVFARVTRSGWTLHAIDADGGDERLLGTIPGDPDTSGELAWSPDRKRVLWQTAVPDPGDDPLPFENAEIFVADANGGAQRNITHHPAWDESAVWSPDGDEILFVSNRSGDEKLWITSPEGDGVRRLTRDADVVIDTAVPEWAVDGSAIAFAASNTEDDYVRTTLWTIRADGSGLRQLVDRDEILVEELAWSAAPDGK